MNKRTFLLGLLVGFVIAGVGSLLLHQRAVAPPSGKVSSFDECVKEGNSVMESFPRQCISKAGRTFTEGEAGTGNVAFEIAANGSAPYTGRVPFKGEQLIAIRSQQERANFIQSLSTAGIVLREEVPVLKGESKMLVAVVPGGFPTGGHSLEVIGVREEGGKRIVSAKLSVPGKGCMVTQAFTYPYAFITVPYSMLPHVLELTKNESVCR